MKTSFRFLGLLCILTLMTICSQGDTSLSSKITSDIVHQDLANVTVTISSENTDAVGNKESQILYEGPYQKEYTLVRPIVEPTEVTISLQLTKHADAMTIKTVIDSGSDIHFTYKANLPRENRFLLVGAANQVTDPKNKFSISGDLNFLNVDLDGATTVELVGIVYDEDGNRQGKQWGPVLIRDNSFLIQGDVAAPTEATLRFRGNHNTAAPVILEPGSEYVVDRLGNQTQEISITGGLGYHSTLVESWQQSVEYITQIEAYATEYDQFLERQKSGKPEPASSHDESFGSSEDSTGLIAPAEGCEAVEVQERDIPRSSESSPRYVALQLEAREIRDETLKKIAEGDGDRWMRYLAYEMGPYAYEDYDSRLAVLQSLAAEFNHKFVAEYFAPRIKNLEQASIVAKNDAKLIPGQKVPDFTLPTFEGSEISLYTLLAQNDIVLIDFWAAWCGPCIAAFPKLKSLHSEYTEETFEIVSVSIDQTMQEWKKGVEEHSLPWVNLGEAQGLEGSVSTMYGITFLPKSFLVDSQGCIYKKDIRPAALEEYLNTRYSLSDSLVLPKEKSDGSG